MMFSEVWHSETVNNLIPKSVDSAFKIYLQ